MRKCEFYKETTKRWTEIKVQEKTRNREYMFPLPPSPSPPPPQDEKHNWVGLYSQNVDFFFYMERKEF
jgi:hypothetical protein